MKKYGMFFIFSFVFVFSSCGETKPDSTALLEGFEINRSELTRVSFDGYPSMGLTFDSLAENLYEDDFLESVDTLLKYFDFENSVEVNYLLGTYSYLQGDDETALDYYLKAAEGESATPHGNFYRMVSYNNIANLAMGDREGYSLGTDAESGLYYSLLSVQAELDLIYEYEDAFTCLSYYNLGKAAYGRGMMDLAVEAFQTAFEIDADSAFDEDWMMYAFSLYNSGGYDSEPAIYILDIADSYFPMHPHIYGDRAFFHLMNQDYSAAYDEYWFGAITASYNQEIANQYTLSAFMEIPMMDEVITDEEVSNYVYSAATVGLLFYMAEDEEDYQKVIQLASECTNLRPDLASGYLTLAEAYSLFYEDYETALPLFEKVVEIRPYFYNAWYELGDCLFSINGEDGDYKEIIETMEDIATKVPQNQYADLEPLSLTILNTNE